MDNEQIVKLHNKWEYCYYLLQLAEEIGDDDIFQDLLSEIETINMALFSIEENLKIIYEICQDDKLFLKVEIK